jgi:hypothetical protein
MVIGPVGGNGIDFRLPDVDKERSKATIGPGGVFSVIASVPPPSSEIRDALAAGIRVVYVFGMLTYRDAFGEQRTTTFRHIRDTTGHAIAACPEGNDST